jgi:hypothetical protein
MVLIAGLTPSFPIGMTIHFGEERINPFKIARIFARVKKRVAGRLSDSPKVQWGKDYTFSVVAIPSISFDKLSG